jgi:hypothetical protein
MADSNSLPAGGPSREEIAKIEIGQTTVSAPVARALVVFFLFAICLIPVIETGAGWKAGEAGATVWSALLDIPGRMSAAVQAESPGLWRRTMAGNRAILSGLTAFEDALEDESVTGGTLRPPAQEVLSGWLGAGNERVYVGRNSEDGARWLFYRPDLEYLLGRGFLERDVLDRRISTAAEWTAPPQPDPRPAILELHNQLASQGIALILVPTPVKPGVHPEKLVPSYPDERVVVQNASYDSLLSWLRGQGVLVFDPGGALAEARRSGSQYLAADTHWRPEAMELVAGRLSAFLTHHVTLPALAAPGFRVEEQEVRTLGDTAAMLDLPSSQQLYPPERVLISRIVMPDGAAWRSDRSADVLVLGDSFSNIYSLGSMGWGDSAGLVEQLSHALGRPVDRIVQNDDGAFATRAMLLRDGPQRLSGKRVVVWQFAARELAFGDWKILNSAN